MHVLYFCLNASTYENGSIHKQEDRPSVVQQTMKVKTNLLRTIPRQASFGLTPWIHKQARMPFVTSGVVHYSGISNEKEVCTFLNNRSVAIKPAMIPVGAVVEHRGGTGTKADAEIVSPAGNKTISIKHHKSGTFDWLNSSAAIPAEMKTTLGAALTGVRSAFAASGKTPADEKAARDQCEELFAHQLRSMPSEMIQSILNNCYQHYTDYVLVTLASENKVVAFDRLTNIPELRTHAGWTYFVKSTPRAKTSAQIWRRNAEGVEVNTKLRLRLVLNNGVSALLGLSAANKSSAPCIKIQQDDVAGFLASLVDPVSESFSA